MITIIIVLFSRCCFGKYFKEVLLESDNIVSKAIILIENDPTIYINSIENRTYNFKVKNYDNDEISEVDIEYYIRIFENSITMIKIYKNGQEIVKEGNETDKFLLSKNIKQEDDFRIEIIFLNEDDQEIIDQIDIRVCYEQKNI